MSRTVLITGGTDGLGLELVKLFAANGDTVYTTGRKSPAEAPAFPSGTTYIQADQSKPEEAAGNIADALPKCDLAILNAGNGFVGNPLDETTQSLRLTLAVNLEAPILIARALAPKVLESAGQLTLIGSVAYKGAPNFASYAAAKAGQHGFIRALREEWQGRALAQIIHPGPIATAMHEKAGLKLGAVRKLFLPPTYAARTIKREIEKGKSPRTVSFGARARDTLLLRGVS